MERCPKCGRWGECDRHRHETRRHHHHDTSMLSLDEIRKRYDEEHYGPEIEDTVGFLLDTIDALEAK